MKVQYKHGWYIVRPSGLKLEVTYFDGLNVFCEDLKVKKYIQASEYCENKIKSR